MSLDFIVNSINLESLLVRKILISFGVIIGAYSLAFWIVRLINSRIEDYKRRHQARRSTYYLITAIVIVSMIFIWTKRPKSITTYLGFLSAGLALALHQVWLNIAGWILILISRPFELGDRIEWGEVQGDVIDIQVFHTTLLEIGNWVKGDQSTGRLVNVPNSTVFTKSLFNFTHGFEYIWNEIKILITFESNWEKGKEVMLKIAKEEEEGLEEEAKKKVKKMGKRYMIEYKKFTPIVYIEIKDSGVQLILRYLTTVWNKRTIQTKIYERVLNQFEEEEDIEFAYQTWRIYNRDEGEAIHKASDTNKKAKEKEV